MRRLLPLCSLLAACASGGGTGTERTDPEPVPTVLDTLFIDEFDGTAIDRAKWDVYTGQVFNAEVQAYVDDTATMRIVRGADAPGATGGALLIHALHRPGTVQGGTRADFASGRLHGRQSFRYGTVSARMKLPTGAGLWPAFWLLGVGNWPDHGEIDIMENVGDSTWVNAALHGPGYSGNTPLVRRDTFPAGTDATGWHVYEVRWTPAFLSFRVDDAEFYRVERGDVTQYGVPAAIDSVKYVILNLALGGGYPNGVNGVRTPYLGLPESSVDRIRRGEARVLVDWVRWTRDRP
jgi:beta-glucanase (GH16 family)